MLRVFIPIYKWIVGMTIFYLCIFDYLGINPKE